MNAENIHMNEVPSVVKGISHILINARYSKRINEEMCRQWLDKLAICTLFIKKGFRTDLLTKVDSLKDTINKLYDNLLDKRLGEIEILE